MLPLLIVSGVVPSLRIQLDIVPVAGVSHSKAVLPAFLPSTCPAVPTLLAPSARPSKNPFNHLSVVPPKLKVLSDVGNIAPPLLSCPGVVMFVGKL